MKFAWKPRRCNTAAPPGPAPVSTAARWAWKALLIASALLPAGSAFAQEIERVWVSQYVAGPKATEREVQKSLEDYFESFFGPLDFQVTSTVTTGSATVYNYDIEPTPPNFGDWFYRRSGEDTYSSQEALLAVIKQESDQFSTDQGCTPATTITTTPWVRWHQWETSPYNSDETATYTVKRMTGGPNNCTLTETNGPELQRQRAIGCANPSITRWRDDLNACGSATFFPVAYVSAPTLTQCSDPTNCDPTSGEKTEAEADFDLGWVRFDRHYRSMASSVRGGFGQGWTHSHNIQLSIGQDPTNPADTTVHYALIREDGSQIALKPVGAGAYEASDGSGDRLAADGNEWLLYQSERVLRFNAQGRLLAQQFEDGTGLSYGYDEVLRLATITHSSGRTLEFVYNASGANAPVVAIRSAGTVLAAYGYTASGQVETVTYPGSAARRYHYTDPRFVSNLTGVTDEANQRYSTYAYDAKARVMSNALAGGVGGSGLSYSSTGTSVVTDALGHPTTYSLTAATPSGLPRKPNGFTDERGTVSRSYYDEASDFRRRINEETDRRGIKTQHTYSEANDAVTGQPARTHGIKEAVGLAEERVREIRTDIASNRVLLTKIGNRETRIVRNARLQPASVSVRDTLTNETRTTTYAYCEAADVAAANSTCPILGLLKSIDGPRGDVNDITTYEYFGSDDSTCATAPALCTYRKGDPRKVTDALGRSTETLGYDPMRRPLSVVDANGVVTDYDYDPRGLLTATKIRGADNTVETDDRITRIEYEPTQLVKKVTLPGNVATTYTYDTAHRLTDITDNAGNKIHYTLDNAGNRKQEDTKAGGTTLKRTLSRVYNTLGQLEALKDASQNATSLRYDANGNADRITDALGRKTDKTYDPFDRLTQTLQDIDGLAVKTIVKYNALDQVTRVTDPNGLNTDYAYNGFGDQTKLTSPDTGITDYTYNPAGLLATKKDANDPDPHRYTYDALNRPKAIYYTATGPADVEYDYDLVNSVCAANETFALGRVTAMRTDGTELKYCYDRFGQIVRKVQTVAGKSFTLRYVYTNAGDLRSITYPDGAVVDYLRDGQQRIKEIGVKPAGGTRAVLLNNATYTPFGPVTGWTYGNGRTLTRGYDLDYRPQSIYDPASGGLSLGYGYNPVGELTELKDGPLTTLQAKYDFDTLGRLTITRDGASGTPLETYEYDKTGNRKKLTHGGITDLYTIASDSHRLTNVAGVARGYDAVGNTTSIGGTAREFVYNANDRMRQVKQGGVVKMGYRYNAKGERVAAINGDAGAVTTYTLYDEGGQWIGDYDGTGTAVQQAVWMGDSPVGVLVGAGAGDSLKYVEPDHLGTPRSVIDATRNLAIWTWDGKSEAFGNNSPNQDPDLDGITLVFNMRFPGQRYDPSTGLSYNYYRDYDPAIGRYVQSDPIGLNGGLSLYSYVGGNPLGNIDPLGLQTPVLAPGPGGMPMPVPSPIPPPNTKFPAANSANNEYWYPTQPNSSRFIENGVSNALDHITFTNSLIANGFHALIALNLSPYASAWGVFAKPPSDAHDPNGAKAPGKPGADEGFCDPKSGEDWVPNPNKKGKSHGWLDADGKVWVPTGHNPGLAHGGPHWDVQNPDGTHTNVYPGGRRR